MFKVLQKVIKLQTKCQAETIYSDWHAWYMHWLQVLMISKIVFQESLLVFKRLEKTVSVYACLCNQKL